MTTATQVRWTPTRAGILNVWRYYREVFEFHEGRLLLRGANGSGKSKALELLLPFLFDASLRANRLSTFGTNERTMHWNLMGEGATGVTRVGYVWLEFRQQDRWFTCGARLQATSRTTSVHPDFFTTGQRIGEPGEEGVLVLTDSERPIGKSELDARIGEYGDVYENAADYRHAVRTTLFPELSEQRYDALITALLQLRMPKLSQRLDPGLLSTLLSKALPPLGTDELADLAEGFERLDAQRERLARLDEESAAVAKLAHQQRTYAQRVLRAHAGELVTVTTELDSLSERAKEASEQHTAANRQLAEIQQKVVDLEKTHARLVSRRDGLMKSHAYREGAKLEDLRADAARAQRWYNGAQERARRDAAAAGAAARRYRQAQEAAESWREAVAQAATEVRHAALPCGMGATVDEMAAGSALSACSGLLRNSVAARDDRIRLVERDIAEHEKKRALSEAAEKRVEQARDDLTAADERLRTAGDERDRALESLQHGIEEWVRNCSELRLDVESLVSVADSDTGFAERVNDAVADAREGIAAATEACRRDKEEAVAERDRTAAEREKLLTEQDVPPTAPGWRTADRSVMSGAPLWQLVDFPPALDSATAAAIEAALESSGLLDAWIGSRGEIIGHDIFADPDAVRAVSGDSLADVLTVHDEGGAEAESVRKVLAAISFGRTLTDGPAMAVASDGSWRVGNLHGSWAKSAATYIGVEARRRNRQRRIAGLDSTIAEINGRIEHYDLKLEELSNRRRSIDADVRAQPDRGVFRSARTALAEADRSRDSADRAVRTAIDDLRSAQAAQTAALENLHMRSAESGLPTELSALEALRAALKSFQGKAQTWLDHRRDLQHAETDERASAESAADAADEAQRSAENEERAASELRDASEQLQAVEDSVGMEYREVLNEIATLRSEIATTADSLDAERNRERDWTGKEAALSTKADAAAQAHRDKAAERDLVAQRFRELAGGNLAADAEIPDSESFRELLAGSGGVRAALDAARRVTAAWPTIPHTANNIGDALRRLSESVHECRTSLSARADLDLESDGDVQLFTAVVDGVRVGAAGLKDILRREADQSRNDITQHEHELFDKTLTGDTRRHLASRIRQANALVDAMNDHLSRVRTASDVGVQLRWQVGKDLPPGTAAARELLLKDPARLNDADREALHRFLRDRIEEAKAADSATSWEQQLAEVFDYTRWHQFTVRIDRGRGEGFQELTKKLHGALSGGEKAIALHLPLFAAVAAHYHASPTAPRVILLDEVFVGVDTANRGQIFALLSALSLDLVLTSDHEWCTYSELSGIAIHQIVTGDDSNAVTTVRFTWNGSELEAAA
ncbi:TIGR02680 family protein [Nocardia nova]|uniref:TIGR02680 family protein n=1 Tax=Nocardia nova TaxID=37330 RepID=A0A2S6AIW3_9NOCA|nr:TIGR02680 family protein [Nocardia nova]PPJ31627.1 TIGR02680 family protein [Nocardia nova]PPJ35166.1 TIGR02680 family protein [Nocardia nova]